MRLRIFSLMLAAFGLVIVLGVGGMLGFFGLAVLSFQRGSEGWGPPAELAARNEARQLAEYYRRTGSWAGVEPRFAELQQQLRDRQGASIALVDAQGQIVTSSSTRPPLVLPPTMPMHAWPELPLDHSFDGEGRTVQTVPIRLRSGEQVGALVLIYDGSPTRGFGLSNLARAMLVAGLALSGGLLGLAALFSRRISRPLRQLDGAARAVAAGDMQVRVRPGLVREIADLTESFNRMADALALADQQRRQLTADVAHELRTPLSVIKGRLEGVQDGVYQADEEQITGLLGEVALLERLIEDLRLLALADAGQLALYPEPTDVLQLLRDTARSFAPEAATRLVTLQVEPAAALPELLADPQRIAQVLGNLVSNALRHTPAGGTVTLRAETAALGGVVFAVSDSGSGISAVDLPHIFDRFYRADRARTRTRGGAGLGLAIARRLVEAHGGQIWAASTPGEGTTISFALPAEPPDAD
jgi:signal transduction histidine kinase